MAFPHFPDRLHAFVWRNWSLVSVERIAAVVGASPAEILNLGYSMGLPKPTKISEDIRKRAYLTVIKRNWHLLPYEQLLELLEWTPAQMAFTLREDDFFYIKLGSLKPACEPLRYTPPDAITKKRVEEIAELVRMARPGGGGLFGEEPLFQFVHDLSSKPVRKLDSRKGRNLFSPRFCYSYFALYGDPLLETETDPYPDGYLRRLAESGVDGVWLQAVLFKLSPFPWDESLSAHYQERLKNLNKLVARARKHGIGIWLYLNEPRSMAIKFYDAQPDLKGVVEGDHAALCSSHPEVQRYLVEAVASICRAVPDLAGFFTISASENLTNCWSHHQGRKCPRCGQREPNEVIAEVNSLFYQGIRKAFAAPRQQLIVWDWGWKDDWAEKAINALPQGVAFMSVSEWSLPIDRGGVKSTVGEYSISSIGPGPRAQKHWAIARRRGLKTIAKIQAGNTWELSAVPYIPALANVARHVANLRETKVDGLMLGWSLGGYPSPNLEVVAELGTDPALSPEEALLRIAERRFGAKAAPAFVRAWHAMSAAFSEFPYNTSVVYQAPLQMGPANLLWAEPTGYRASMVGFPYDALDNWRAIYPVETFIAQMEKVAEGFFAAHSKLLEELSADGNRGRVVTVLPDSVRQNLGSKAAGEERMIEREAFMIYAATLHFRSVVNQCRFVRENRAFKTAKTADEAWACWARMKEILHLEKTWAVELDWIQQMDSRIGFEASNQYYYVPLDLVEKQLNCQYLLDHWLKNLKPVQENK